MSIRIVTDSSCDLPARLISEHDIVVVPLTVRIAGHEYEEGIDITPEEFFAKMKAATELPKTSQPNPQAFLHAFERSLEKIGEAAEVLCITLSSQLSGTFQSAKIAQRQFKGKATIFDSLSGTLGLGFLVLEARRLVDAAHSMAEILERLHGLRERLSILVSLDTLENAVKGGRVKRVHAAVAQVLRLKILVRVVKGRVEVYDRVRGCQQAINSFLDSMAAKSLDFKDRLIGITHVNNEKDAHKLAEAVERRFSPREIVIAPMGSTIATYAGSGAIALIF
ncbi:MAG TPA: DegV family protein [Firmicutes bacterium]|nr:DegV family protein [Bacillota bacterium]